MDVGLHCSIGSCNQVDFLPFTCDCCRSVFCLAHRSYDAHECPLAGSKDRRVIECPLCRQMLHWTSEQDVNVVWERHVQGGQCAPQHGVDASGAAKKKPKKPRCGAAGCREVLTASNQFQCGKCRQSVCMKHRFESDHDCETARRAQQQRQWGGARFGSSSSSAATAAARKPARAPDAAQLQQSARAVASSVASGTRTAARSLVQGAKSAATAAASITTASEECPMCGRKFAYVSQLIAHVNQAHPEAAGARGSSAAAPIDLTAASGGGGSGREVCPQCRAEFRDVGALIQHAETAHAQAVATGSGARRGSSATESEKCSLM